MNEGISRRNFIGGAALGGAALALGALAGCAPQGDKPTGSEGTWDAEVDLLVCGCGGAGMACAVEAKDNGVENVLIIEKGDQIGGTTAMSQGMIAGWDTQLQKSQGVELTYDAMYANLMNNASYHLDPALTKITVENSGKTIDWLIDRVGVKFTDQIDIYYGPLQMMHNVDGMGYVWEISDEATVAAAGGKVKRGEGLEYIKGADATELAANMGVDAAALAETIEAYNAAVDSGVDREIGGFPTAKLEAPFLAVPVVPCEIITYGGVARTEQGEVIRADGEVMPGLFVGGEASCNSAYMGFTLSNCFTWGRIGAQSAAAYLKA